MLLLLLLLLENRGATVKKRGEANCPERKIEIAREQGSLHHSADASRDVWNSNLHISRAVGSKNALIPV